MNERTKKTFFFVSRKIESAFMCTQSWRPLMSFSNLFQLIFFTWIEALVNKRDCCPHTLHIDETQRFGPKFIKFLHRARGRTNARNPTFNEPRTINHTESSFGIRFVGCCCFSLYENCRAFCTNLWKFKIKIKSFAEQVWIMKLKNLQQTTKHTSECCFSTNKSVPISAKSVRAVAKEREDSWIHTDTEHSAQNPANK